MNEALKAFNKWWFSDKTKSEKGYTAKHNGMKVFVPNNSYEKKIWLECWKAIKKEKG